MRVSVALYDSESWTLKANDIDKLRAFEMIMLQTYMLRILRITWRDHRTNESVITKSAQTERELRHVIRAQNLCTKEVKNRHNFFALHIHF